ncbi:unnamed protein product [Arctogadus glacialis]
MSAAMLCSPSIQVNSRGALAHRAGPLQAHLTLNLGYAFRSVRKKAIMSTSRHRERAAPRPGQEAPGGLISDPAVLIWDPAVLIWDPAVLLSETAVLLDSWVDKTSSEEAPPGEQETQDGLPPPKVSESQEEPLPPPYSRPVARLWH